MLMMESDRKEKGKRSLIASLLKVSALLITSSS
jgi:hypothetical protein